ncbi:MAG: ABC transporter permease subunit [Proteobacteria bacterium]|nr:ABC transporter permease subunit [Pseudomonadota bacterium]
MQKAQIKYRPLPSDLILMSLLGAFIYGLIAFGREWQADFNPSVTIDLAASAIPLYATFSALRGLCAFVISLIFTFVVGFWAAKSPRAERILIPLLDILQSIPVLGFLPGLVLALVAIFPTTNTGLELAAILMIFTGQVWNMTFSFYASLKSLPGDFSEVSQVIGLSHWKKLWRVEVPFSMMNLVWNSLMSLSGGWFFLSVCEAFSLGKQNYRLPGLGAYMAVAIQLGDTQAMLMGIAAMAGLIIVMDMLIWRPILAWAHQFRLEDLPGFASPDPLMKNLLRESAILNWFTIYLRRRAVRKKLLESQDDEPQKRTKVRKPLGLTRILFHPWIQKALSGFVLLITFLTIVLGTSQLVGELVKVTPSDWENVIQGALFTLLRVLGALAIASLWAVPAAIWIGTSPQRIRIAQPIIQVLASFPAPMLYPLALTVFLWLNIPMSIGAMLLMLMGVQWYVLFNVLAGAIRIPQELEYAMKVMGSSRTKRWFKLYLPSIFPSLVTGWVTAAGGAWNASIVAECLFYKGETIETLGLGSLISQAASNKQFELLAASLTIMVVVVVMLNRMVWAKIYGLAQTRYRLDF